MKTKVIFRKWNRSEGGGIIALFPEEPGTDNSYTCSSFEHVGQHGAADPLSVVQRTKPVLPREYRDLQRELQNRGYKLQVIHRLRRSHLEARRKSISSL